MVVATTDTTVQPDPATEVSEVAVQVGELSPTSPARNPALFPIFERGSVFCCQKKCSSWCQRHGVEE